MLLTAMLTGTTFANFAPRQCKGVLTNDAAISSNPSADDIGHPMYISDSTVEASVNHNNKVYYHRSNPG